MPLEVIFPVTKWIILLANIKLRQINIYNHTFPILAIIKYHYAFYTETLYFLA